MTARKPARKRAAESHRECALDLDRERRAGERRREKALELQLAGIRSRLQAEREKAVVEYRAAEAEDRVDQSFDISAEIRGIDRALRALEVDAG